MRILLVSLAIVACSSAQGLGQVNPSTSVVNAFIVQNPNKLVPEARIDVGSVVPSDTVDVSVSLVNTTNREIRFNRIEHACSCTDVKPEFGKVAPKGDISIRVKLRTPDVPSSMRGSGFISFYENDNISFTASLDFGFPHYVGFPVKLLTVGVGATKQSEEIVMPIVIGTEVGNDEFEVEIVDVDVGFKYEVDRERGLLRGVLNLEKQEEFNRLYGNLRIVDLSSGRVQSIPLILESESTVRVQPSSLRFFQRSSDALYVANIYVRSAAESASKDSCTASVSVGSIAFKCTAKRLNDSVFKVEVVANGEQVSTVLSQFQSEAGPLRNAKLTVAYGDSIVKENVPVLFQENLK